jgi:hypothetical protein
MFNFFWKVAKIIAVSPAWSKLAQLHLKLANCDRGPGTEEMFGVMFHIVKIECPLICSNPIADFRLMNKSFDGII